MLLYNDACTNDLPIPRGKYYLADAGFEICDSLMVPYRCVQYHLAEWGHAAVQYILCFSHGESCSIQCVDLQIRKNSTISVMLQHRMLLNAYLEF